MLQEVTPKSGSDIFLEAFGIEPLPTPSMRLKERQVRAREEFDKGQRIFWSPEKTEERRKERIRKSNIPYQPILSSTDFPGFDRFVYRETGDKVSDLTVGKRESLMASVDMAMRETKEKLEEQAIQIGKANNIPAELAKETADVFFQNNYEQNDKEVAAHLWASLQRIKGLNAAGKPVSLDTPYKKFLRIMLFLTVTLAFQIFRLIIKLQAWSLLPALRMGCHCHLALNTLLMQLSISVA